MVQLLVAAKEIAMKFPSGAKSSLHTGLNDKGFEAPNTDSMIQLNYLLPFQYAVTLICQFSAASNYCRDIIEPCLKWFQLSLIFFTFLFFFSLFFLFLLFFFS